jgi:hypothetical protein
MRTRYEIFGREVEGERECHGHEWLTTTSALEYLARGWLLIDPETGREVRAADFE